MVAPWRDMNTGPSAERWIVLVCVVLAAMLWVGPYLWRVDLFNNDAAHHVFWLYRFADPALFPNDPSIPYFQTSAPWGYRALYAVVAPVADALLSAEVLSIALLTWSLILAWKIGSARASSEQSLLGLATLVGLVVVLRFSAERDLLPPIAFQRTFALPLLLMTLWALVRQRYAWVGVSWLMAALVYPVVLPVQGLTAAIVFMRDLGRDRRLPPHWLLNMVLGLVALGVAALGMPVPPEVGPPFTYEQAMRMPEFGLHGRLVMYPEPFFTNWLRGHRTGLGWSPYVLLAILIATLTAWRLGGLRAIPFAGWVMAAVGVVLWGAMRLFPEQLMFGLYLPNRHSRWAIGIFGMLALGAAATAIAERFVTRVDARRWFMLVAPLTVVMVLLPSAVSLLQRPVNRDLENVYAFVAALPKNTLVAAHPDLADFVPVRTQRSVLASTEISMAWMENYYKVMKPRVEASLRAAYATSIEEMDLELEPYGVDVILTGPPVWQESAYFEPFNDLLQDLIERGAQAGFALKSPPADRVLFRSGDYYVVRVDGCVPGDCP